MKVLCEWSSHGPAYVRSGWARAFADLGHQFMFWHREYPIFDVFESYFGGEGGTEGSLFLGTTYGVTEAVSRCIQKYPHVRVGLFASAWGRMSDAIDTKLYPIDVAKDEEKRNIEKLFQKTGRPDFVFLHCVPSFVEGLLGGWKSTGTKIASVMNAADIMVYRPTEVDESLVCDGAMVGGYWPYKARNIDPYIFPLLQAKAKLNSQLQTGNQYSIKIFGNTRWPVPQYLGEISLEDEAKLYSSAKVCLNIHEPHSVFLNYDCIERPYKASACGGCVLSDYVEGWNEILDHPILMARTPKEFEEQFVYLLEDEKFRKYQAKKVREEVLAKHTYHHRVGQFLELLGVKP